MAGTGPFVCSELYALFLSACRVIGRSDPFALQDVNFTGQLLAKIRLPEKVDSQSEEKRCINLLSFALQNVLRELQFFEDTAARYQLDLTPRFAEDGAEEIGPNQTTRSYMDMMLGASSPSASLLEGFTLLYATEVCYFKAWSHAKEIAAGTERSPSEDTDGGALRTEFIPNWSSEEFGQFVKECEEVVNMLDQTASDSDRKKSREVFRQVCALETTFWPQL